MGTALRFMLLGSVINLALSVVGKTKGFWAAKVTSVGEMLLQHQLCQLAWRTVLPRCTKCSFIPYKGGLGRLSRPN